MTTATPEPQRSSGFAAATFPAWALLAVALGSGVVSGATTSAVTSRDVSDLRQRQDADDAWKASTDKRLAEVDKSSAVSNAKIEKDIESMKTGISDLRSALMGGRAPVAASPTP